MTPKETARRLLELDFTLSNEVGEGLTLAKLLARDVLAFDDAARWMLEVWESKPRDHPAADCLRRAVAVGGGAQTNGSASATASHAASGSTEKGSDV
jgi:hypothetical protein